MRFAVANLADGIYQTVPHLLQRLHELADFIFRPDLDFLSQIARGNTPRNVHHVFQRPENGADENEAEQRS